MTTTIVAHTINIHVNTSSPPHPSNAPTVNPPTIILPANVSPKRCKGKVAVSSQTNEQVWHLKDDKILGASSGWFILCWCLFIWVNDKAASVEIWRLKAYQHYNVFLQCVVKGGQRHIQFVFKCKFNEMGHESHKCLQMKTSNGTRKLHWYAITHQQHTILLSQWDQQPATAHLML